MPQQTYFVNCPFCGHIIEVVCPKPAWQPTTVEAHKSTDGSMGATVTSTGCPSCHNNVKVFWYFR